MRQRRCRTRRRLLPPPRAWVVSWERLQPFLSAAAKQNLPLQRQQKTHSGEGAGVALGGGCGRCRCSVVCPRAMNEVRRGGHAGCRVRSGRCPMRLLERGRVGRRRSCLPATRGAPTGGTLRTRGGSRVGRRRWPHVEPAGRVVGCEGRVRVQTDSNEFIVGQRGCGRVCRRRRRRPSTRVRWCRSAAVVSVGRGGVGRRCGERRQAAVWAAAKEWYSSVIAAAAERALFCSHMCCCGRGLWSCRFPALASVDGAWCTCGYARQQRSWTPRRPLQLPRAGVRACRLTAVAVSACALRLAVGPSSARWRRSRTPCRPNPPRRTRRVR